MSGEDNDPSDNGGDDTGHGGQGGQPQGGQPQGGQPQGGQPQGGQPQGGQPQGGQPQGGQPQGGQAPPGQGGQYGGQPQGQYGGGQSTMDQVTGMLVPAVSDYLLLTVVLSVVVAVGAGLAEGISSFLDGPRSGPLLLSRLTQGNGVAIGEVALVMTLVVLAAIYFTKNSDEDTQSLALSMGVLSFVGSFVFALAVSVGYIMMKTANNFLLPSIADAIIGSILVGVSGLIVGAASVFAIKNLDPDEQSQTSGYQQGAPGGQPPQGGQGPR